VVKKGVMSALEPSPVDVSDLEEELIIPNAGALLSGARH
jgi:hypothetical protein